MIQKNILTPFFRRGLLRDAVSTVLLSTLAKTFGFLVPFFISAWFGVTTDTDAFFFAYGFIVLLTGVFSASVENVIVPFVAEVRGEGDDKLSGFLSTILIASLGGLIVISGIFLVAAYPLARIFTRFPPEGDALFSAICAEITPLIILITLSSIISGTLNACKRFTLPALIPGIRAVVTLLAIFLLKGELGIHAVAWGYVAGEIFRLVVMGVMLFSLRLARPAAVFNFDARAAAFFKMASLQTVCLVAVSMNAVIDKTMASWLQPGSVTMLHYADRLYMIPVNLILAGLLPVVLSHWSASYYAENDADALITRVRRMVQLSLWVSISMAVILCLGRHWLVLLTFARGAFPMNELPSLEWTWIGYIVGLAPYVAGMLLVQAYLVLKKTTFLMKIGFLSCGVNIAGNLVLMRYFGIAGIALSTSVTSYVTAYILFTMLNPGGKDEYGRLS